MGFARKVRGQADLPQWDHGGWEALKIAYNMVSKFASFCYILEYIGVYNVPIDWSDATISSFAAFAQKHDHIALAHTHTHTLTLTAVLTLFYSWSKHMSCPTTGAGMRVSEPYTSHNVALCNHNEAWLLHCKQHPLKEYTEIREEYYATLIDKKWKTIEQVTNMK